MEDTVKKMQIFEDKLQEQEKIPSLDIATEDMAAQIANAEEINNDIAILKDMERAEFIKSHKTEILDSDMTLFPVPSKGCDHCYGRGFEGASVLGDKKDIKLCHCILNKLGRKDVEYLTYGQFKKILEHCNLVFKIEEKKDEVFTETFQGTDQVNDSGTDEVQSGYISDASVNEVGPARIK